MTQQILSEEFRRMQKLAGIITESQFLKENIEINLNDLKLLNNDNFPDNQIVNEDIFSVEELEYYYKKCTRFI